MPSHTSPVSRPARRTCIRLLVALCALSACVALAACGGSGSASSSAAKRSSGSAGGTRGPGSSRFAALRSCLAKQGIALPSRPAGARRPQGTPGAQGPGAANGPRLPKGVTQAQFQAALKKCGGDFLRGGKRALNSASSRAALTKYAACLRQNGIDVPAPNTTGNGPVFSTKGIDTSSASFKAAQSKCRSDLKGAFAGGGAPRSGAPPAGAPPAGAPSGAPQPGGEGSAG
jgi:hypothetical protein